MSQFKFLNYFFVMSFFTSMVMVATPENDQEYFVTFPPTQKLVDPLRSRLCDGLEIDDFLKITHEKLTPEQVYDKVLHLYSVWEAKAVDKYRKKHPETAHLVNNYGNESYVAMLVRILLCNDSKAIEILKNSKPGFAPAAAHRRMKG